MNIRQAILKAADHIEKTPGAYQFTNNDKPDCGTPGCMFGWVGVFAGIECGNNLAYVSEVEQALGYRVTGLAKLADEHGISGYTTCPKTAAQLLRLFAGKYHPTRDAIPANIRAIFEQPESVKAA
jgi:hypothetical protein